MKQTSRGARNGARWFCALAGMLVWLALPVSAAEPGSTAARGAGGVLDTGEYHACILLESDPNGGVFEGGGLYCWGENAAGQVRAPQGRYLSVSSGVDHSCALRGDGQPICWGNPAAIASQPPAGPFVALSAGEIENCGLRSDGQLRCWGGAMSAAAPTTGTFIAVGVSPGRGCAIRTDGTLHCWQAAGVSSLGAVPAGRYLGLSLGTSHACALRSDGKVQCWGSNAQGQTNAPTAPDFIAVASGHQHSCGLQDNGSIVCWGGNPSGQLNAPTGRFDAISAGRLHTCARNEEGSVQCWGGSGSRGELAPPTYNYHTLAVGSDQACGLVYLGNYGCAGAASALTPPVRHYNALSFGAASACGITIDGRAQCWGEPLGTPPNEALTAISVGDTHACALRLDGGAVCWGDNSFGQGTPPPQVDYMAFNTIASGDKFTCGLSDYAGLVCWGQGPGVTDKPLSGPSDYLSVHGANACIVHFNSGQAECWGEDAIALQPPAQTFSKIAVGARHACAISASGLHCWGDDTQSQLQAPTGEVYYSIAAFGDTTCAADLQYMRCWGSQTLIKAGPTVLVQADEIAAGEAHNCTVRNHRGVGCWGDAVLGQRNVPVHRSRTVSANGDHSCSLRGDGRIACWGDDLHGASTPAAGTARALDVGQLNGCAVGTNGAASCWGWNVNGQGTPPAGLFRSIATGLNHSCGVRDDGSLACWGYNADGQATAPAGLFRGVDVGERHSCAITGDGGLQCWGLGSEGQTTLPDLPGATYRALAVGAFHNCAILSLGNIVCWGRNDRGQATPPEEGAFVSIAAGAAHTCAVRDDGMSQCWGANDQGQAPQMSLGPTVLPQAVVGDPYRVDLALEGTGGYVAETPQYLFVNGELPWGIDFNAYGQLIGIPSTEGTYEMTLRARDANGLQAERDIQITVMPPRPQIEVFLDGIHRNGSGWYSSDVHVTWDITPLGNGLTTSGCGPVTVDYDTPGVEFRCVATSNSGTTERTVELRRDATPPETVFVQTPPVADNYGTVPMTFAFESTGSDLSGHAGFECNLSQVESDLNYFDCSSPFVLGAQSYPGFPGTYTLRVRAKDAAGNVDATPATHTWTILRDTTFPVISPNIVGTPGDNGWYRSDVSLTWSISDPETPLFGIEGCTPVALATDSIGIGAYCEARSWAGKQIAQRVLRRDTVAPSVSATPTSAPNAAGWYRNNVTVAFACSDATSGLAAGCPQNEVLSQEGTTVSSIARTVRDMAGNVGTSNVVTINLDKTPPVTSVTPTTQPNAAGWYRNDIVVNFTCTDALSGMAAPCTPQMTVSTEGSNNPGELVHDRAGNTAFTGGTGFFLDKTAPTIAAVASSAPNANGWYRNDVSVFFNCGDALSGLAQPCPTAQLLSQEGTAVSSIAQTVSDVAGNLSAASNVVTVKIDKTAPVLSVTMPPAQVFLNASHNFNLSSSDALSGVVSQSCGAINTATPGTRSVTCTATDRAGNTVSRSATYRVVYDFVPLSAPLANPAETHVVQAPRSVPLEWRVRDANGVPVANATLSQATATEVSCPSAGVAFAAAPVGEAETFENFGDGRYRRNWWINYTGVNRCLRLDVVLNDGIVHSGTIRVVPKIVRTGGPQQPSQQAAPAAPRSMPSSQPSATPRSRIQPLQRGVKPAKNGVR